MLRPRKGIRLLVQVSVVQKCKMMQMIGFKAVLTDNRVGFWAWEAIYNVPVSQRAYPCVSLTAKVNLLLLSGDRERVFLAHRNAIKNLGNVLIFFPGSDFYAPSHCYLECAPMKINGVKET